MADTDFIRMIHTAHSGIAQVAKSAFAASYRNKGWVLLYTNEGKEALEHVDDEAMRAVAARLGIETPLEQKREELIAILTANPDAAAVQNAPVPAATAPPPVTSTPPTPPSPSTNPGA